MSLPTAASCYPTTATSSGRSGRARGCASVALRLMRSDGLWEEVLREDAADEEAHRALMRRSVARGDRPAAARQFRLLCDELSRLGAEPSEETLALQREVMRGPAMRAARFLHAPVQGRERELASALGALRRAAAADGGALLVTGSLGIGKTRVLEAVLAEGEELDFHTLRGTGQEEEGGRRTPRSWRRSIRSLRGARSWPARSPTARRSRFRDCCRRCAPRRGRRMRPWTAVESSVRWPSVRPGRRGARRRAGDR